MRNEFLTLGIETSCDDTAVAVVAGEREVLSSVLSSQIEDHAKFGGVVPELASRIHAEAILPLLDEALEEAGVARESAHEKIGLIAVTAGPGLMGSLLVGVMTAKALSQAWGVPIIGVNHLEGHLFANRIAHGDLAPPFICGIFSGGHSEIILVRDFGDYELLGATRDDAAGEAYDKAAKLVGLPYPGGPEVDRLAREGNPSAYDFPVPLRNTDEIEFSFSGLKTAVLTVVKKLREERGGELSASDLRDVCASFQRAASAAMLEKLSLAVAKTRVKSVAISGGVAANSALRGGLDELGRRRGWRVFLPPRALCTDNAAMIAAAGFASWSRGARSDLSLSPDPSWEAWKD